MLKFPDQIANNQRNPQLNATYSNSFLFEPSPYFTKEGGLTALRAYWNLFILDAFLGNFDRHADNWSYFSLAGLPGIQAIAPIYDCGSCLYPNITDEAIPSILASESEVNMRVDKFPTAALLLDNGHKVNYKDFIASGVNNECTAALLRVFPRLDMGTVLQVIDVEPLSDIRKKFYKTMLTTRYNRILAPAFHKFNIS